MSPRHSLALTPTRFLTLLLISQRGLRRPGVLFLFLATLLMYASAVVYWVGLLLNTIGVYNVVQAYGSQLHCQALVCEADAGLIAPPPGDCPSGHYGLAGAIRALTLCAPTIILAVNVRTLFRFHVRFFPTPSPCRSFSEMPSSGGGYGSSGLAAFSSARRASSFSG